MKNYTIRYRKEKGNGIKAVVHNSNGKVYVSTWNNTRAGALTEALRWIGSDYTSIVELK